MLLKWLLKLYAVYVGLFALLLLGSGRLFGVALMVAAIRFDRFDPWQAEFFAPPYLNRFPDRERKLIDRQHHLVVRVGLFAMGLGWILQRPLRFGPGMDVLLPIFLLWAVMGLVYLTLNELLMARTAASALTYEHYRMEAVRLSRLLFIIAFTLAMVLASYLYRNPAAL